MNNLKNHVTLVGKLGAPAEITNFENGGKVARFNIATPLKTKGSAESPSEWHRAFAWGGLAGFIENYGAKGRQIAVHGRLVQRTYINRYGQKRSITEVEVRQILGL